MNYSNISRSFFEWPVRLPEQVGLERRERYRGRSREQRPMELCGVWLPSLGMRQWEAMRQTKYVLKVEVTK